MADRLFYKYTSARVATIILATRCLRFSSPLTFNDPFDITQELRLNFDEHDFAAALAKRVLWLIEHADAAPAPRHPVFAMLVHAARTANPDARREMAAEFARRVNRAGTPGQAEALALLKDAWRALVPTFRVLCLSEVNESASMWSRYADEFRGVVFEFAARTEQSVFHMARPVVYEAAPLMADVNAWISCMLGEEGADYRALFLDYLHVKTPDWSNEREWRIAVAGRRPTDDEMFGDYGFNANDLLAIYFGPKCAEEDRGDMLRMLSHGLEHVRAFAMELNTGNARVVPRPLLKP